MLLTILKKNVIFFLTKSLDKSLKGNIGLKLLYFFKWLKVVSFKLVGSSAKTDSKQDTKTVSYFISKVKNTSKNKTVECKVGEHLSCFVGLSDLRYLISNTLPTHC